jgi:hypothetical protein
MSFMLYQCLDLTTSSYWLGPLYPIRVTFSECIRDFIRKADGHPNSFVPCFDSFIVMESSFSASAFTVVERGLNRCIANTAENLLIVVKTSWERRQAKLWAAVRIAEYLDNFKGKG